MSACWLIERLTAAEDRPFLHWVGDTAAPVGRLAARMVTDWPPTEEDLDYALQRVGDDRVAVELEEIADVLARNDLRDAERRRFTDGENALLSRWRGFAMVERLIDASGTITLHGGRADAAFDPAWLRTTLAVVTAGGVSALVAVRRDGERWRLDAGDAPRVGQSLRSWLAGSHVRFTARGDVPEDRSAWTLSGVSDVPAAEQFVLALHALAALGRAPLDCVPDGTAEVRLLPPEAANDRAAFARAIQAVTA